MLVEFGSRALEERFRSSREAARAWGEPVGKKYIMRIRQAQAATTFTELQSLAALRVHPLRGRRRGQWAATIHGRWRLVFRVDEASNVLIIEEVSNHHDD